MPLTVGLHARLDVERTRAGGGDVGLPARVDDHVALADRVADQLVYLLVAGELVIAMDDDRQGRPGRPRLGRLEDIPGVAAAAAGVDAEPVVRVVAPARTSFGWGGCLIAAAAWEASRPATTPRPAPTTATSPARTAKRLTGFAAPLMTSAQHHLTVGGAYRHRAGSRGAHRRPAAGSPMGRANLEASRRPRRPRPTRSQWFGSMRHGGRAGVRPDRAVPLDEEREPVRLHRLLESGEPPGQG